MTTDSHTHFVPPGLLDNPIYGGRTPHLVIEHGHQRGIALGERLVDSIVHNCTSVDEIVQRGESVGVHKHILSPWVAMIPTDAAVDDAAKICRLHNALMAEAIHENSSLEGLAAVPLQDPYLALEILDQALSDGLKGVELTTAVAGRFIGDPLFDPFWDGAASLGAAIFIHPTTRGIDLAPFQESYLWNSVGNPMETTVAASQIVMRGIIERNEGLRILLAHGGGALPALIGRIDHSYDVRSEPPLLLHHHPSRSLRRLYFDTVTHDEALLKYLIDKVGADHVIFGTDAPFDMGSYDPTAVVRGIGLSAKDQELILADNAARFFGLTS